MNLWGDLLEATGFADLLSTGRWVTLSNGTRVKLDTGGRLVAGLPGRYHGAHVRDLPTLFRRERELGDVDCEEQACSNCPATFANKKIAVGLVLDANPDLLHLLESDGGAGSAAYRAWIGRGRRGKKPERAAGDGRFDALNEQWEMRGPRAVASWLEALYVTVPTSRRWEDLAERLPVLAEATGFEVWSPAEAERAAVGRLDVAECVAQLDRELDALFERARAGRISEGDAAGGAEVPF